MKRIFVLLGIMLSLFAAGASRAADAVTLAAQQEAEANYKRLTATLEEYQTTQADLQKRISALAAEVNKLRDDVSHAGNNSASKDALHELSDQIRKVDDARVTDNKRISETLEKLGESIRKLPLAMARTTKPPADSSAGAPSAGGGVHTGTTRGGVTDTDPTPEDMIPYIVVSGDQPVVIAKRLQTEKNITVTAKAIINANPTVEWTKLKVGQKLLIPKPKA